MHKENPSWRSHRAVLRKDGLLLGENLECSAASSRIQKLIICWGQSEQNNKGTLKWEMRLSVTACLFFSQLLKM